LVYCVSEAAERRRRKMALLRILLPVMIVATSVVVALIRRFTAGGGGGLALVIIDVQNCFTSGGSLAVPDGDAVIPVINRLRSDHGENFDEVVLSQDWHCSDHVSFASQHPQHSPFDHINLTYLTTGQSAIVYYKPSPQKVDQWIKINSAFHPSGVGK